MRRSVPVLLALVVLAGCTSEAPRSISTSSKTPSPTSSGSTQAPRPAEVWAVYSEHDGSDHLQLGAYAIRARDGAVEPLALRTEERFFHMSPDGRFLAIARSLDIADRSAPATLAVTRTSNPSEPRMIARIDNPLFFSSVLWSADGERLWYFTAPGGEHPDNQPETLWETRRNGRGRREIADFPSATGDSAGHLYRMLIAFDEGREELLWMRQVHEGAGGWSNVLWATNVRDGRTRRVARLRGELHYSAVAATHDGARLYYIRDGEELIERMLASGEERSLYRTNPRREAGLQALHVSTDGEVLFQGTPDPIAGRARPDVARPRTTTYALEPGEEPRVLYAKRGSQSSLVGVSPDGRWAWIADAQEAADLLLDVRTGARTPVAAAEEDGWLDFRFWAMREA